MSNSATVTPYASAQSSGIIADGAVVAAGAAAALAGGAVVAITGAAVATAAIAEFLCDETEAERAAVEWLKSERRNNLLHSRKTSSNLPVDSTTKRMAISRVGAVGLPVDAPRSLPQLQTVPLTIRDSRHLLSAAAKLGYTEIAKSKDFWLLRNKAGAKLALHAGRDSINVIQRADRAPVHEPVVVQHNLDRVSEHLQATGMSPAATRLVNGEIEIAAQETSRGDDDDRAKVTIRVKRNGELHLDVDRCIGNRCEAIVQELATAVGGKIASLNKKDAYFRPTRKKAARVRI